MKLVGKVNAWYDSNLPRSLNIFERINDGNMSFVYALNELNKLSQKDPNRYETLQKNIKDGSMEQEPILFKMKNAIKQIRENFVIITKESGADVYPEAQTRLLDACEALPGVLMACIPGAGGYDAISLLTTSDTDLNILTKGHAEFENVTWLNLKQANLGLEEENSTDYENL